MYRLSIILFIALHASMSHHETMTLHVNVSGNDAHVGTEKMPLATIAGARDVLRKRFPKGIDRHVNVIVGGGTYRISEPIQFGPPDGGGDAFMVTYQAAKDHKPVISGGRAIIGWKDNGNGSWSATIAEVRTGQWRFRELFVQGKRRPRAQHPNKGFMRIVQSGADKRTAFTFKPGDFPRVTNTTNIELLFLHDWSTSRIAVKHIDWKQHLLTLANPIGCNAPHYRIDHFESHPRYRLENSLAFLDAPGEWFLDDKTGVMTYRPFPDETLEQFKMSPPIAPKAMSLLRVAGTADRPVKNLHFKGLHFAHCAWQTPKNGYAEGQAGFHEKRDNGKENPLREIVPAAITFEHAVKCKFANGSISHVGGSGIAIGSRCDDYALTDTHIHDVAGNGMLIGEDSGRRINGKTWWQVAPEQAASNNHIKNNVIEHCGQLFYGAVGMWVGFAQNTLIEHNEIRNLPYTGISIGWMWNPTPTPCRGNRVERNHIHHVMQTLSDGGGIYTLGRQPGTVLAENVIHDVPLNLGRAESNGMFLDEGTTDIIIRNNLIYGTDRSSLRFHRAGKNLVEGNILVIRKDQPVVRYNATDAKLIELTGNDVIQSDDWQPDKAEAPIFNRVKAVTDEAGVKKGVP